jgi:23S rRNA pseudouridine1911/1915/1917 synthase
MMLTVLHADNHLLVVAKPAGLPTVPDASGDASLLTLAKAWVKAEKGKRGEAYLGVVHRLDRPVSGVVVFARTSKAAARLSAAFKGRAVAKTYLAVSAGEPRECEGVLTQWLRKDAIRNRVEVLAGPRPGALQARTRYRVEARAGTGRERRILLVLEPETGRPHQLRVAAASLGTPLLGDLKYGARQPLPDKSIALHARALELPHPTRAERLRFECAPPERDWWRFGSGD